MRDHKKLRAFELADEVAVRTYKLTASFPKEEVYGLTSQMRRASVSTPSNIVEGCGRETKSEYKRFLDIAYASLRELEYQLDLSTRLDFCNPSDSSPLKDKIVETQKVLGSLIRSLKPQTSESPKTLTT